AGITEIEEYPVSVKLKPRVARAGAPVELRIQVQDPKTGAPVKQFELMHEKLLHMFLVSEDLQFFVHDHPAFQPSGDFLYQTVFPHGGAYRVVTDFYPTGGTPQMIPKTVFVAGEVPARKPLVADVGPQRSKNLEVSLTTEPPEPLAGFK